MSLTPKELEGLLAGEAEGIIKRLLAERKPTGLMSLTDIEQLVLRAGERFEGMLMEALIEAEEAEQKGERPTCPECGGTMRHRGYRGRKLVTQTGEVRVRRRYYRCANCGRGLFPPG
jgi:ribosomal protein S27AE